MVAAHCLGLKGSGSTCCSIASHAPAAGQAAKPTQAAPSQDPALTSMPQGVRDACLTAGIVHGLAEIPPSKPAHCLVLSTGNARDTACHIGLSICRAKTSAPYHRGYSRLTSWGQQGRGQTAVSGDNRVFSYNYFSKGYFLF